MTFNDGDFVKLEYSAWRTVDDSLVYTTNPDKAKEGEIFDENTRYGPQLVILGKGTVIKGLDEAIRNASLNEAKTIEIEPSKAFGERNPALVRVMPIADFRKKEMNPYPGMQVEIDGSLATVKSVTSGRVLVDTNHPLAGEKLKYEFKVVSKVDGDEAKAKAIADSYALSPEKIALNSSTLNVQFNANTKKDAGFFIDKNRLVSAVLEYLPNVKSVDVTEEYKRPEDMAEKKEDKKAEKQEEKKEQ